MKLRSKRADTRASKTWQKWLPAALTLLVPALAWAEESAEHAEHGAWDTTSLIASFVNFFVLVAVFIKLFRDGVQKGLKERRAVVERELTEAARLKAEAEAKHKEYSERLAKLDQELATIKAEMIESGKRERDRIVAEAEHKAARLRRETEFLVEQQAKQLHIDLTREAVEAAIASAEQLLVKATTSFDQQRIAQEYLASLEGKRPGSPASSPKTAQAEGVA